MVFVAFICIILCAVILLGLYLVNRDSDGDVCTDSAVAGALAMMFFIGFIASIDEVVNKKITPMDVYQGKTTLKYEIVDGIKVDSIVIWKNDGRIIE